MRSDSKVYEIARIITESASQTNVGITAWGFIVIKKSLILKVCVN
jgi:hypothetical protein